MADFCKSVPVPMMCPSSPGGANPACSGSSTNCCQQSSCWKMGPMDVPMGTCKPERGPTTCVGLSPFGGKGACACQSGVCGSNGICTSIGASPLPAGPSSSSSSNSFGRLYEDQRSSSLPAVSIEDHTRMWMSLGAIVATVAGAFTLVSLRIRHDHGEANRLQLLPDSDCSGDDLD